MIEYFKNLFGIKPFWFHLWNSESELGHWEIWHDTEKKSVVLHFVPEDDYSDSDVKTKLTYDQFKDLIKFLDTLK